jgi:ABC-type sugar transport system ATPase subunit
MTFLKVTGINRTEGNFFLRDINFSQRKYEKLAIAGETGSGKSTILKIIAGLVEPDSGDVLLEDQKVIGPSGKLVPGHPEIAYLSQHFELAKFLRVEQILSYANSLTDDDASILYEICQIDHLLKRNSDQLSGGEKQRIAIARLLIGSPKLLLLDEPFSHLDMVHKTVLKSVIKNIGERLKITCILVSHDPSDMLSWADKIIVMKDGQVVQKGSPLQLYRKPANEYVAGLFGKYNLHDGTSTLIGAMKPIKPNGKSYFTRPEDFVVSKKKSEGIKAVVSDVLFHGGHYEMEVLLPEEAIILRVDQPQFERGDTVYVSLANKDGWLMRE